MRNTAGWCSARLRRSAAVSWCADPQPEVLEGSWDPKRLVIVEFPDADHARRWWSSPEYAAAKAIRQATSVGTLVLLEGVSPS